MCFKSICYEKINYTSMNTLFDNTHMIIPYVFDIGSLKMLVGRHLKII